MPDLATNLLLSVVVFAGAFVSSLAGFAFSAVAGAILLRIFQPMEAVPLMMACSIGVQAANLWALRRNIQWEGSLLLIVGGALGTWLRSTCCRTWIRIFCALRLGSSSRCTPATDAGAGCRNNQPAAHGVDRIRRRLYRRFDGDARRHSDHLVRHARYAEERPAQAGAAVHRHHAGAGTGAIARASKPVFQARDRPRHQPAGAVCRFPARHCCIPEHQ